MNLQNITYIGLRLHNRIIDFAEAWDKQHQPVRSHKRLSHDLLCSCRKCEVSINSYCRKLGAL